MRTLARFVVSAVLGFAVGGALLVGLPNVWGWHAFSVMSGSMSPAIHTGDVVVDEMISPLRARIGDIVTFQDPKASHRLITHRLRAVRRRGDKLLMTTKGDANNTAETWAVPADGRIGRVKLHVPHLGHLMAHTRRPEARIALVGVPALVLGALELLRIWRPRTTREDAGAQVA